MFLIILPIFMAISVGYFFGKIKPDYGNADKLINDYVLYVALPALLFLAIARSSISELKQWGFMGASLIGIFSVYVIAGIISKLIKIQLPQSSILSMGASYGTTGYMGIPILISVYGNEATLPAAIATILHNIPVIIAVILCWNFYSSKNKKSGNFIFNSIINTFKIGLTNPLVISVFFWLFFVFINIKIPIFIESFSQFLGNAAGPTALFALGLSLSRLKIKEHLNFITIKLIILIVLLKIAIQPIITFLVAYFLFNMKNVNDVWLVVAIIMAAQPIGAGVYVFARKYEFKDELISLSIILSLLISIISIPVILNFFII